MCAHNKNNTISSYATQIAISNIYIDWLGLTLVSIITFDVDNHAIVYIVFANKALQAYLIKARPCNTEKWKVWNRIDNTEKIIRAAVSMTHPPVHVYWLLRFLQIHCQTDCLPDCWTADCSSLEILGLETWWWDELFSLVLKVIDSNFSVGYMLDLNIWTKTWFGQFWFFGNIVYIGCTWSTTFYDPFQVV